VAKVVYRCGSKTTKTVIVNAVVDDDDANKKI
jgi:hypothetical protein